MIFYNPYKEKLKERNEIKFKNLGEKLSFLINRTSLESDNRKYDFHGRNFRERLDLVIYSFFPSYEKIMDRPKTPRERWHSEIRRQPIRFTS